MTESPPLARSPLHAWQESHGARFAKRHGWWLVESFPGTPAAAPLRLADVSPFAKVQTAPHELPDFARAALGEPLPGKVAVVLPPAVSPLSQGEGPGERAPGWLCCLSENQVLFLATRLDVDVRAQFRLANQPTVWDVTSAYAGFLLIGEAAATVIGSQLNLGGGPAILSPGTCVETGIFGIACLLVRPPDEPSVVGIWIAWDVAEYVWERLRHIGDRHGLAVAGMEDALRFGWQV